MLRYVNYIAPEYVYISFRWIRLIFVTGHIGGLRKQCDKTQSGVEIICASNLLEEHQESRGISSVATTSRTLWLVKPKIFPPSEVC